MGLKRGSRVPSKRPNTASRLFPRIGKKYGLVLDMSIAENITLASLNKISAFVLHPDDEIQYSQKYVSALNVKTSSVETQVKNLSGGNQQKVVIGKWLMTEPEILILDEHARHRRWGEV